MIKNDIYRYFNTSNVINSAEENVFHDNHLKNRLEFSNVNKTFFLFHLMLPREKD